MEWWFYLITHWGPRVHQKWLRCFAGRLAQETAAFHGKEGPSHAWWGACWPKWSQSEFVSWSILRTRPHWLWSAAGWRAVWRLVQYLASAISASRGRELRQPSQDRLLARWKGREVGGMVEMNGQWSMNVEQWTMNDVQWMTSHRCAVHAEKWRNCFVEENVLETQLTCRFIIYRPPFQKICTVIQNCGHCFMICFLKPFWLLASKIWMWILFQKLNPNFQEIWKK